MLFVGAGRRAAGKQMTFEVKNGSGRPEHSLKEFSPPFAINWGESSQTSTALFIIPPRAAYKSEESAKNVIAAKRADQATFQRPP